MKGLISGSLIERYAIISVEKESHSVPMDEYITNYLDVSLCDKACRSCPNYGKTWGCPPYKEDRLIRDGTIELTMYVVTVGRGLSDDEVGPLMLELKKELTPALIKRESEVGGQGYGLAGGCGMCEQGCSREFGGACRHPDMVRPSLEAVGFNLVKTSEEIFGRKMEWSESGRAPWSLTLIVGVVY